MSSQRSPHAVLRLLAPLLLAGVAACAPAPEPAPEPVPQAMREPAGEVVRLTPAEAARQADSVQRAVRVQAAPGLEVSLWASKSLIVDPTALSIDDQGVVYAIQTQRDGSTMDIRQNRDWYVASLAMQTVEERREFYRRELAPERSRQNAGRVRDLNQDGSFDWRDLTVKKERVFRIIDTDGDGRADLSQLAIEGFNDEVAEPAQGLQVFGRELYLSAAPNLWRLRDADGDGVIDARDSISRGYHVKVGYGGHSLDGVVVGPDGRLYLSVGDIGMSVTDGAGRRQQYANQGAIVRMNPDGSDLEVFAAGLRNVYDFAFDDYGNLIAADNDGDNQGEAERIVYVTSGQDSGWRINWQFGKYTDPRNNGYKPWMDEGMHKPRAEGQAAWFTPPVAAWYSGPAGMVYNPGTALSERWRRHFFVASSANRVNAFTLDPQGAGFKLGRDTVLMTIGGVPTGMEFGPDGALYVADWVATFNPKGDGRIWKVDAPGEVGSALRTETRSLLAGRFEARPAPQLRGLLGHADQRVRLKAQFELARRGDVRALLASARQREPQLARVHALWGIAQVARRDARQAALLAPFLRDADPEIRAQAARQLGDVRHAASAAALLPLLRDASPRARFFAAEALGRIRHAPAVQPLVELLVENDERDVYLRHAGVTALARIGEAEPLVALARHPSRAARIAAVVALRKMRDAGVAAFLADRDESVVTEAAQAINDDGGIAGATAALAAVLEQGRFRGEPLLRRAINANLLLGTPEAARRVAAFAARPGAPEAMRIEAVAVLGVWPQPSVLDRVDGIYRGPQERDAAQARAAALTLVEPLFTGGSAPVRVALAQALAQLDAEAAAPALLARLRQDAAPEVRVAAVQALQAMGAPAVQEAVQVAAADTSAAVRTAALAILPTLRLPEESTAQILERVVSTGSVAEQQSAVEALGKLRGPRAQQALGALLDRLAAGSFAPGAELELEEAVQASGSAALQARLQRHQAARTSRGVLASFHSALHGGNSTRGRQVVLQSTSGQCTACHSLTEGGATVGPNLGGIGARLAREQLLEALVDPNARIAPGYGAPSAMPPMHTLLTRREIRDVVEFLSTLRR